MKTIEFSLKICDHIIMPCETNYTNGGYYLERYVKIVIFSIMKL